MKLSSGNPVALTVAIVIIVVGIFIAGGGLINFAKKRQACPRAERAREAIQACAVVPNCVIAKGELEHAFAQYRACQAVQNGR